MIKKTEVDVSKETDELMDGIVNFAVAFSAAVKDGWQPGQDVPVLISAALANLVPAFDGIDKVKEELSKEKAPAIRAITLGAIKLYEKLIK